MSNKQIKQQIAALRRSKKRCSDAGHFGRFFTDQVLKAREVALTRRLKDKPKCQNK